MRIVSLAPGATETLFALGVGDDVVGVTHACDAPAAARERPKVTGPRIGADAPEEELDEDARALAQRGQAIYALDAESLLRLRPDLIVTTTRDPVCAASPDAIREIARAIDPEPPVLVLEPTTLGEVMGDIRALGEAVDRAQDAEALIAATADRIEKVEQAVANTEPPRVLAIEWFDPPTIAGYWVPQLIELAGGEDVIGFSGEPTAPVDDDDLAAALADVVLISLPGCDAAEAQEEAYTFGDELEPLHAKTIVAFDAAVLTRPGPRLIDGLETLAHILHPERVETAPAETLPVAL